MSLTETSLKRVIWNQYVYKLIALNGMFTSLMATQLAAFALSLSGTGGTTTGYGDITIKVKYFSGDIIFYFTLIWAFMAGMSITIKAYRDADFIFVTNRWTSHLSNIALLLTESLFAGLTSPLLGNLLKLVAYWGNPGNVLGVMAPPPGSLLMNILVTTGYAALLSCLGYLTGMLAQVNKLLAFVVPCVLFGSLFLQGSDGIVVDVIRFYAAETSVWIFCLKAALTLVIVYPVIMLMSDSMEVRR